MGDNEFDTVQELINALSGSPCLLAIVSIVFAFIFLHWSICRSVGKMNLKEKEILLDHVFSDKGK